MFFKKRQPKFKETSEDDSWIVKTWNTQKGRAGIKLAIYGLFILFILLLILFRGNIVGPKEYHSSYTEYENTLNDKISNLKKNNFEFKYTIVLNGETTSFYGKRNKNLEMGYKEDHSGITKYLLENGTYYKVGLEKNEPTTDIYAGFNMNYLNVTFLTSILERLTPEQNDHIYTYNLENNSLLEMETSSSNIKKITIKENQDIYELEYKDIGEISSVELE